MADDRDAGDVVTLADPPAPSFPWLRKTIGAARGFLANGGMSWRRMGQTPAPEKAPTTGGELAGSLVRHMATTSSGIVRGAVDAPFWGAQKALNWYDFARTGYAGFIGGAEMLAPTFGGAPAYMSAASRPGTLGVFGGDVAARNLTKAGRPTAQAALELARQMEEKGFTSNEIRQATNELIERHDPALGGVHKGAEGKWRFESDTSKAGLTGRASGTLEQVLDYPELYVMYPELRKMPIRRVPGQGAAYMQNTIVGRPVGLGRIEYGAGNLDRIETILHEVTHGGPQRIEGFARGTSPEAMSQEFGRKLTREQEIEAYALAAGEVEPRNVEARARLSAGERRAMDPVLTEDRPRAKQYVLLGDRHLGRSLQLSPAAPSVKLVQLRRMMAPNKSIETWAYDMVDAQGRSIGKINGSYFPAEKELRVSMIQLRDPEGKFAHLMQEGDLPGWVPATVSARMLSVGQTRDVFRELKRHFPERVTSSGVRQTGVRGARGEGTGDLRTGADDMTRVPMKGSLKAITGLPSLPGDRTGSRMPGDDPGMMLEEGDRRSTRPMDTPDDDIWFRKDPIEWEQPSRIIEPPSRPGQWTDEQGILNIRVERPRAFQADEHIGRSAMRRITIEAIDDSGPIQMATVRGLDGETYRAPVGQLFGLSSSPPIGSVGYAFMGNGRPDQAFLMGVEDPTLRPRDQADGSVRLYAKEGQFIGMGANGDLVISAPGQVRPQ